MRFSSTTFYVNVLVAMAVVGSVSHVLLMQQASLGQQALHDAVEASDRRAVLALGSVVHNEVTAAHRRSEALARASLAKLVHVPAPTAESATAANSSLLPVAIAATSYNVSSGPFGEGVAWSASLFGSVSPRHMPSRASPFVRDVDGLLDDLAATAPPLAVLTIAVAYNTSASASSSAVPPTCSSKNTIVEVVSGVAWLTEACSASSSSLGVDAKTAGSITAAALTLDVIVRRHGDGDGGAGGPVCVPSMATTTTIQRNLMVADDGHHGTAMLLSLQPLTAGNVTGGHAAGCVHSPSYNSSTTSSPNTAARAYGVVGMHSIALPGDSLLLVQDPVVLHLKMLGSTNATALPSNTSASAMRGDAGCTRAAKLAGSVLIGWRARLTEDLLAPHDDNATSVLASVSVDIFTQVQLPIDTSSRWHITLFMAACFNVSGMAASCSSAVVGASSGTATLKVRYVASTDPTYVDDDEKWCSTATTLGAMCEGGTNLTEGYCICPTATADLALSSMEWKGVVPPSSFKFSGARQLGQLPGGAEECILRMMMNFTQQAARSIEPFSDEDDERDVSVSHSGAGPTLLKRIYVSSSQHTALFVLVHPSVASATASGAAGATASVAPTLEDAAAWMPALLWMVVLFTGAWSVIVARRLFVLPMAALSNKVQYVLDLSQVWAQQQPVVADVETQRASLHEGGGDASASFAYHEDPVGITSTRRGEDDEDFFLVRRGSGAQRSAAWDDGALSDVTEASSSEHGDGNDDEMYDDSTEIKGFGRRAQSVSSTALQPHAEALPTTTPCFFLLWFSWLLTCCCRIRGSSAAASTVHPEGDGSASQFGSRRGSRKARASTTLSKSAMMQVRKHQKGQHNLVTSQEAHDLHRQLLKVFQLTNMFSKYVPKEVVKDLMRANRSVVSREMSQRMITLLFCDIANFTTFCELVAPGDVVDLLDLYFTKMTSVLLQHGCTIDKYIGDAIMGFWGAPLDYQYQGFSSCCAALHMQYMVAKLRPYFAQYNHHLHVRIGLHRGVAAVGNIGCRARISYTALGDAVNTAARLEGLNKFFGTKVCVSQNVLDDMEGINFFACRALGSVRVKGKSEPLMVHELIGVRLNATSIAARLAATAGGATHPSSNGQDNAHAVCGDGESEYSCAAKSCHTGFSASAADKFAELTPDSEFLAAKKFKALSERQIAVLGKMDVAVSMYHRFEVDAAISLMELILNDHHRTLEKLEIHTGMLREQLEDWRASATSAGIERSNGVFDPSINMVEK